MENDFRIPLGDIIDRYVAFGDSVQGALIEGIFGAEESRRHQLHCRFVREDNRRRFAKGRAISWNIRVLNRFECARRLNISIPSYGGPACTECA